MTDGEIRISNPNNPDKPDNPDSSGNLGGVRVERVTTREQLFACWSVRLDVFVGEQEVPLDDEIDELDHAPTTTHVLALDDATGSALGTGRLLRDGEHPEELHIGRMAVRREARGRHVGAAIMRALEQTAVDEARARKASGETASGSVRIVLSAQETAMGFYATLGYTPVTGEQYLDAGIVHQDMHKHLEA